MFAYLKNLNTIVTFQQMSNPIAIGRVPSPQSISTTDLETDGIYYKKTVISLLFRTTWKTLLDDPNFTQIQVDKDDYNHILQISVP